MSTWPNSDIQKATPERTAEIQKSLTEIRGRVSRTVEALGLVSDIPKLIAVSKYKPSADILVCYELNQRDFGENYVQELVDKAKELPIEIQWHFIGTLQSNKAKLLASIPNLHTVQTISSEKTVNALHKALPSDRIVPLNVLIQINTSGEDAKSGMRPLVSSSSSSLGQSSDLQRLAKHIVTSCPKLRLQGLMTIGALDFSLSAHKTEKNADFDRLSETRDILERWLQAELVPEETDKNQVWRWGDEFTGKLILSMGMSNDFEDALKAGSDLVRVGTGIFGSRKTRDEIKEHGAPML
ncbi:hypothetical protein F5876DRAFT_46110 [Lentinula aff. lateritia]|uniref:Uncharacterized protein n=1 Tax=Lentinula aff. lateritia TaxID=2804960 RepID=A0ACC1TUU1_9AGAR|nr:hypothetical protein F5876DRAFT_46110 [Lentinula aff. lateritia]